MSKIFGIHFAMHDNAGCLHQWVPGDEVPAWALDRVGEHCLILPPADEPQFDEGGTPSVDDAAIAAAEGEGLPPAGEGDDSAADPAVPDFTSPAKPKTRATKGN